MSASRPKDRRPPDEARADPAPARVRTRSGGRSERVRRAVGEAVLAFLAEGKVAFTTVEVAERAGVSRRTLYRWWPEHDDLLVEALSLHVRKVEPPDTGSWESDVRAFAHLVAAFAADPVDLAMSGIMAGRRHPDFNALVIDQYRPVLDAWRQMVARAVARGEAGDAHAPGTVVTMLVSPLFLGPLMLGRPSSEDEIDRMVDLVLAATRP
ncbi:TetR/AcrR family transcriptional regulator [Actinocorallia populi]|uniref:TetR/AcrR family transcriptional regulator n=1 Tax=Actinocorallia populi TaxID=2079200 RepID=UPI000D0965C7|nr:TetR/AcrR family transcriptional regulator [Actinocorallia populi]